MKKIAIALGAFLLFSANVIAQTKQVTKPAIVKNIVDLSSPEKTIDTLLYSLEKGDYEKFKLCVLFFPETKITRNALEEIERDPQGEAAKMLNLDYEELKRLTFQEAKKKIMSSCFPLMMKTEGDDQRLIEFFKKLKENTKNVEMVKQNVVFCGETEIGKHYFFNIKGEWKYAQGYESAAENLSGIKNAIGEYYKKNKILPKSLDELTEHVDIEDPFNPSKKIGYWNDKERFMLWSVGADGIDSIGKTIEMLQSQKTGQKTYRYIDEDAFDFMIYRREVKVDDGSMIYEGEGKFRGRSEGNLFGISDDIRTEGKASWIGKPIYIKDGKLKVKEDE